MVNSPPPELLPEEPVDPAEDEPTETSQAAQPSSIDSIKQLRSSQPKNGPARPQPTAEQRQNAWGRLNNVIRDARNKLGANKSPGQGSGNTAAQAIEQKGKETIRRAERKAAKKFAQQAGKQVAAQGAKMVAAATSEFWVPVLVIIGSVLLIVILVVAIFAFVSFSGRGGGGVAKYPSSAEEKYAAVQLLALSGDPSAKAEVIAKQVGEIKKRLESAKTVAGSKLSESKRATFNQAVDETVSLLDQLVAQVNDPVHRAELIAQINAKLKALQSDYSELFFSPGVCADLQEFIDNKKFIVQSGPNGKLIVKGQMMNNAGQVWPASKDLCNSLVMALRAGFTITTGSLSYNHKKSTVSGFVSRHWCGAAIDISEVNGKPVNGSNADAEAVTKFWYEAGRAGKTHIGELIVPTPYRQYEMKNNKDYLYGAKVQRIHETHIHLAGRREDPRCK